MQEYTIERTIYGREISRDRLVLTSSSNGLCRANPEDPSQSRDIAWYDQNILRPMIERGEISDGSSGPFDDRKMRYDRASFHPFTSIHPTDPDEFVFRFGHSHYKELTEKANRTPKEAERLTQLGVEHFDDQYAFFPRNPGVTGLIKTNDGKIIVGQRDVEPDRYDGLLQGAAGHLAFRENPQDVSLVDDMYRELVEETGVRRDETRDLEFLGLFSDPSVAGDDLDFTYLVRADLPSSYFTGGAWKERVPEKEREHKEFFAVPNYDSLQRLVHEGDLDERTFDIVFSTRGTLATLTPEDFK